MTDKSWELLTKLLTAYGCDISEIEDEFDFDEICDRIKEQTKERVSRKKLLDYIMTEQEKCLYWQLMCKVEHKSQGNADEEDIQRALGALYECWRVKNDR